MQAKDSIKQEKNISEYIIDETAIRVGSEYIWLWIAVEPKIKRYLQQVYPRNGICLLQRGSFRMWEKHGHNPVSPDGVLGIRKPVNS